MFKSILDLARRNPSRTGIRTVRQLSDNSFDVVVTTLAVVIFVVDRRRDVVLLVLVLCSAVLGKKDLLVIVIASFLYAGTLATIWTTAPSLPQRSPLHLAHFLVLATLTIAARCYASANSTQHPLVQFKFPSFSPIDDSKNLDREQSPLHSSSLVLSRLSTYSPHRPVQSDTSVILRNSKKLLHNQNSITITKLTFFRIKRELKTTFLNRIANFDRKADKTKLGFVDFTTKEKHDPAESKKSDNVLFVTKSRTSDSSFDSVANESVVNTEHFGEIEHQNDSSFFEKDASENHFEGTERPMLPVHDYSSTSCEYLFVFQFNYLILKYVICIG